MPRSNQTKRLLAQSLMDLMTTTPLEKISVNDIVDHAGVGRNTFYYHFEDKYDLVNWYFQSGVTQFLVERSAYASWNALLKPWKITCWKIKCFTATHWPIPGRTACSSTYLITFPPSLCSALKSCAPALVLMKTCWRAVFLPVP